MAVLDDSGLVIATQPEIEARLKATIRAALKEQGVDIDLDEGPEQQVIGSVSNDGAERDETVQAIYGAFQGRGRGILADFYAGITGTRRRAATPTRVPSCTVNLNAHTTLEAGVVVAVHGNPDVQAKLVAAVSNDTGATDDIDATFECLTTGPIPILVGTLTDIVTSRPGWNSVTNAADGIKGRLVADDVELEATRKAELAGRGKRSIASVRARLLKVDKVISAKVYENVISVVVDGRPPKSIEAVVWDDGAAANDIAQVIYDYGPEGIEVFSIAGPGTTSGSATLETEDGTIDVPFTRATVLRTYVAVTVVGATCSAAQIKAALEARGTLYVVAELGSYDELIRALRDALPATIGRITDLRVGTGAVPSTTLVTPSYAQVIRIAAGDVVVTGVS